MKRLLVMAAAALPLLMQAAPAYADPVTASIVTAIGLSGTAATVATFVINTAITMAATAAITKLTAPKNKNAASERQASVLNLSVGEGPREAVFGRAVTGGQLLDAFNFGGVNRTDWEVQVIALADHKCHSLLGYYIGDTYYAFAGNGPQAGFNGQLEVYFYDGTWNQAASAYLLTNSPNRLYGEPWSSYDRVNGVAYVVVAYKADDPKSDNPVWPQGRPGFRWDLKGAFVYDPRKDSTVAGGSGAHRISNPATWEWSDNAILCRYKYTRGIYAGDQVNDPTQLLIGRGLSAVEAPPARVIAYANICDEAVALKAGGTEPRYRVGGVVKADDSFITVDEMFAAAMAGVIVQHEGSVEVEPGVAKSSVVTITDADILVGEDRSFEDFLPDAERVNTVSARYIEPTQLWKDTAAPVRRSTADITGDGGIKDKPLALSLVTSGTQAQRCGEIERRRGRLEKRAQFVLGPAYSWLEEGDWLTWQSDRYMNGSSATFRVEAIAVGEGRKTSLVLRQISSSCYAWSAASDESTPGQAPVDEAGSLAALALTGVDIAAFALTGDDGLVAPAIKAIWTTPVDPAISGVRIEVRKAGGAEISADVQLNPNAGQILTTNGVIGLTGMEARLIPVSTEGRRCTPTAWTAVTTHPLEAGGPDVPSGNLWRKVDYVVSGSAVSIDPAFGVANWGFRFPGSTAGAATVSGKTFALQGAGGRYSVAFRHKITTGAAPAQIRVGFRDAGGGAISDVPDQVVAVGTSEAWFTWDNIKSADPDFVTAKFQIFTQAGDVAAGKVVDVADVIVVYGNTAPLGFTPSPDDPEGLYLAGAKSLATLDQVTWATQVTGVGKPADFATKSVVYRQTSVPSGAGTNDIWIQLDGSSNPIAIWAFNGSTWINGADRTQYNTAAGITGQGPWATYATLTPTQIDGRTRYFNAGDGKLYDYRGMLFGYSIDSVAGRGVQPLGTTYNTVTVSAHTVYFPGASGLQSVNVPAHTFSGLSNDTDYAIYYRPQYGDWFAPESIFAYAFNASVDGYMLIGYVRTPLAYSGGSTPSYTNPVNGGTITSSNTNTFAGSGVYDFCVDAEAWISTGVQARELPEGSPIVLMEPAGDLTMWGSVSRNVPGENVQCWTFRTDLGAELTISDSTPIMTRAGAGHLPHLISVAECEPGMELPHLAHPDDDHVTWGRLVVKEPAGRRTVARISAGNGIYAASNDPGGPFLFTHNMYAKAG